MTQNDNKPAAAPIDDVQIKHMVDRFLGWPLPSDFSPDAGISFKPTFNEHLPGGPMRHAPSGTNLLSGTQAEEMVRYMVAGAPAPSPADERAAFEAHLIDTYGVVQDDDPAIERVKRDWTAGWQAARATSANETGAEGETCRTCSGRGMIGGPSYYAPDEGGEPCPDCAATQPAQADARVGLTADMRESVEHAATWLARSEDLQNKAHAERLRALLQGANHA